jgi:GDPmannose 4,6-dehydratase
MSRVAFITGITGQDGSYLAELLLDQGYEVHGMYRRSSTCPFRRIEHLRDKVTLHVGDLSDQSSLTSIIDAVRPHEVYNLAAQSFVGSSWTQPIQTTDATGTGTLRLLEAIRSVDKSIRYYQASSSEMFGQVHETPQRETTRFHPRSPYGVAKVFSHWTTVNYRESYDMYACSGILFNHESPRRGIEFVTRKITNAVARISLGLDNELRLGNLQAKRDWGYAGDYVRAMWLMLQQDRPQDYVVGTGELHSVEEFVDIAFSHVDLNWRDYVVIDPKFFRPAEVELLLADPSKAHRELNWRPEMSFNELVTTMVDNDLREQQQTLEPAAAGEPQPLRIQAAA